MQIVSKDAEVALTDWACELDVSYVALCQPAIRYYPYYWWTRFPQETTKIYNLVNLFSPASWMRTFISVSSIVGSLKIATHVGKLLGLSTCTEEIIMFPFR